MEYQVWHYSCTKILNWIFFSKPKTMLETVPVAAQNVLLAKAATVASCVVTFAPLPYMHAIFATEGTAILEQTSRIDTVVSFRSRNHTPLAITLILTTGRRAEEHSPTTSVLVFIHCHDLRPPFSFLYSNFRPGTARQKLNFTLPYLLLFMSSVFWAFYGHIARNPDILFVNVLGCLCFFFYLGVSTYYIEQNERQQWLNSWATRKDPTPAGDRELAKMEAGEDQHPAVSWWGRLCSSFGGPHHVERTAQDGWDGGFGQSEDLASNDALLAAAFACPSSSNSSVGSSVKGSSLLPTPTQETQHGVDPLKSSLGGAGGTASGTVLVESTSASSKEAAGAPEVVSSCSSSRMEEEDVGRTMDEDSCNGRFGGRYGGVGVVPSATLYARSSSDCGTSSSDYEPSKSSAVPQLGTAMIAESLLLPRPSPSGSPPALHRPGASPPPQLLEKPKNGSTASGLHQEQQSMNHLLSDQEQKLLQSKPRTRFLTWLNLGSSIGTVVFCFILLQMSAHEEHAQKLIIEEAHHQQELASAAKTAALAKQGGTAANGPTGAGGTAANGPQGAAGSAGGVTSSKQGAVGSAAGAASGAAGGAATPAVKSLLPAGGEIAAARASFVGGSAPVPPVGAGADGAGGSLVSSQRIISSRTVNLNVVGEKSSAENNAGADATVLVKSSSLSAPSQGGRPSKEDETKTARGNSLPEPTASSALVITTKAGGGEAGTSTKTSNKQVLVELGRWEVGFRALCRSQS